MRQIPVKQAQAELKRLVRARTDQRVVLLTHKRDRSLTVTSTAGQVTLAEQGYVNLTTTYSGGSDVKHQLMTAFKREFPRSHQLYISREQL